MDIGVLVGILVVYLGLVGRFRLDVLVFLGEIGRLVVLLSIPVSFYGL
jgi:hypothetical protein